MVLNTCKICGNFTQINENTKTCLSCIDKDEKDFKKIKDYLFEHPGAKIFDVIIELDVSITKIKHFLREERIEIVEKDNRFLKCEICGKPIRSGKLCEECCKQQVAHDYRTMYTKHNGTAGNFKVNFASQMAKPAGKVAAK